MTTLLGSVHDLSNNYVADYAALDPIVATVIGISGYEQEMTDYSPDGHAARAELGIRALHQIRSTQPVTESELAAKAVFLERIGLEQELIEAGRRMSALNVIDSPVQAIREVFDRMPTDTAEHWENIAARLNKVPAALAGVRASLTKAATVGQVSALRQVNRVADQANSWASSSGFFHTLVEQAGQQADVSESLRRALSSGAEAAATAYAEFSRFLRDELARMAPHNDAVGAEIYQLESRWFLGAQVDLAEAYEWGWAEFLRIESEMKRVADRIKPGATLAEVAAALDADPKYQIHGQPAFQSWMRELSDRALHELRDKHFTIPDPLMTLECNITTHGGSLGIYYVPPTDRFTRPGAMWWSISPSRTAFPTWRETTTVYHEGVPGHHLQCGIAVHESARLNQFQRLLCWIPGHGEGWALYAERLMHELGYLQRDGELLGMLDAQLFRAARVIVDIGMHEELVIPQGTGFHEGERWTAELGLEFLVTRTIGQPDYLRDEIDRYLGWPGQAPAYKLGERLWLEAREDARIRQGSDFDLKKFHTQALELGSMGLDTLRERLAAL